MPGTPLFLQAATGDTALPYTGQDFRRIVQAIAPTERVLTPTAFRVRGRSAGANFTIEVDAGQGVVAGDDVANQGSYLCTSTGVESLVVPAAPATGTRTHRVVLQVRDKLHGAYNDYAWETMVLPDTGTGLPALPNSALPLARITVAAGQPNVTNAHIIDDRPTGALPRASVYLAADFSFPNAGYYVAVPLTANILAGGMTIASSTRLVLPATGTYRVATQGRYVMTTPTGGWDIRATLNGSTVLAISYAVAASPTVGTVPQLFPATVGDYVEFGVTGTNPAALKASAWQTYMTVEQVSP